MAKNFLDPEGLNLYTQALINGGLKVGKAQDSSFANDASTAFYASHADAEGLLGLIPMENIPIDAQNVFIGEYGVTTYDDIIENINNGKIVFIKQESSNMLYTLVNSNSTFCSFANVRTGVGGWSGLTATEIWVNSSSVWDSSFYQLQDYISDLSNIRSKANNALPRSGGQMTGDIDLNGNALLVRKSGDNIRNGIWFTGEGVREGIYVGNTNMRLFLEADPNLDLIHKKGGDFYDILDTNNVATKGNIYPTTWGDTLDNIINAVNAGKIVILKRDITYNEQKYSPTYVLNCFVKRVSDDYITECRFYARLEDNVVAEIACKRGPTWVDNGVIQLQENLVSGTNIKTINGNSVLGSGNIDTHEVFIAEYGVTNPQDVFNAIEEGKLVIAKKSDVYYQPEQWLSETSIRFVGFGYLNNFNFFDLTSTTWGNVITYKWQRTDEKVSTITGNIDNTKYPTTKAVTDYAQPIIDSSNKLSAALVDDSSTTHKFVSTEEKAEWDAKLPLSGGTMTGSIDLNGNALLVRNTNGERPGIQFRGSGADEGVYVGNGNMRMILETGVNDTIRHKEGDNYYVMLDSHNTKTINGQSLLGAGGNIDINSVFFITYGDTTISFSDIVTAYNDGKIIIAKHEGDIFMPISATITNDNIVAIFFGSAGFFDGEANILSFYVTESGYSTIGLGTLQLEINETNKLDADLVDDSSSSNKFVTSAEKTTWNDKQDAISDLSDIRSKANGALQRSGGTMTGSLNLGGKALLVSNDRRAIEFTGSGTNQGVYVGNANMRMILETGSGDTIRHKHRENNQDVYHVIFDEGNTKTINGTSLLGSGDIPFPDVSEFITKSVNDLLNYYTKQNTYTQAEVDALIGSIQHFHYEIYTELPQSGESNVLYLIGPAGSGKDRYEEYVYANNSFTKIGDTSIDLSNYITTQALNSALQQFAQDLQTELNNYALKSQIKTVNENSLIGSGDVSIHPEIVNLTDGEHSSGHYEDLMRTVDKLKLNTPQIFLYTAYNNNHIATTAMCFSTCTNTETPTTNAVIKQTLFLGTYKSIRTLSNTVDDNKYRVVNGWAQILDIKQSDLDSKVSRAGSSMTGDLNMDYHELQVAGNRNGIKFESNATGVLVGNGNMNTTIQSGDTDLKHRKGLAPSATDCSILDTSNVKTLNNQSIYGSGNIDFAKYEDTLIITESPVFNEIEVLDVSTTVYTNTIKYTLKPNQKIVLSDTVGTNKLYLIDATDENAKSILSSKTSLVSWNNFTSSDIVVQLASESNSNQSLTVNTYWRGTDNVFIAEYGVTTYQQVLDAYNAGKIVVAIKSDLILTLSRNYDQKFYFGSVVGNVSFNVEVSKNNQWVYNAPTIETVSNKATDFTTINNTKYPTTKAVADYAQPIINSSNKLDADVIDDSSSNNKFVSESEKTIWGNKQDAIADLDNIRRDASAGASAYQKPATGIPASDIESGVIPDVSAFITKSVDDLDNYTTTTDLNGLLAGKQSVIDTSNMLDADLVDDSSSNHKFVTASDKTNWDNKQDELIDGTNIKTINDTSILGSGNIKINDVFWVEYNTTPFADILAAYNAGKTLFANYAGYKFVNIGATTDNDNVTTFVFNLLGFGAETTVTVIGFTVSLDGDTTIYSNISTTDMQTLIDSSNKLNADLVDDSSTTHKFVTSDQTETWNTVTEKAPLPFVVTVSISPAGDVTSISHTVSEINAAYSANKQLRLKCTNAQQSVWFEEDLTRINQSADSYVYVSHTVTDEGTHYIVTIYDDSGTTKARFETVDDKAYAKYNDVLINSVTPTIAVSTVTIDGYTLHPSEETFVVKPYQKIAFSDTNSDYQLYIIDATNPSAKTVISQKSHLITWDNQSDTDITIQVGIDNEVPGTLNVSTYWRGIDNVFIAEYNVTSISEIQSAVDSGRVVMCRAIESGDIVYYQLSQSSSTSFIFFRFVGARYYRITLNKSTGVWSTSDDYLQSTSNRDSSIDSSASTTHYPSTKAVYDFVIDEINKLGEIVTVGATSDVGDVGSTATLTIKVAGSVVAQGTGTVTATISRGQEYVVEAERVYDYITPTPQTFTAANPARTVTMNYTYIPRDTITINQTESDEHAMITGNVQGNVIKAIRNASHLYLGTQTETGNQLICQLQDLDGTKYSDGTSAALDGSEGDQWLKLPVFWWKVTPIGTAGADGAYDEYSFSFAFAGEPDLTWKKWEGDTNLLGAKKMYVSDGKGYSRSGVIGTANFTQATGNGYASARGTGYSCVTWEWQWMMCILFYAWYGRMNSQAQCGTGSNTNTRTLGTKDSLGMTDTTSSNGSADNTKFWGIENWWGDIAEWIGNVTMQDYVLTLTDMNTKQSRTVSGWYQFGGTGGYASRFKVTENIDFIPTAKNGTDSTCYCDWVNGNSGSRVVCRSNHNANTYGGVAYVSAVNEPSGASAYVGSRLAFNGTIVEAESVAAYKAALSV